MPSGLPGSTLAAPSASSGEAENHDEENDDPGNEAGRGFRPLREGLLYQGAEKRKQHGSKLATVFRDPNEADRVWVLFDWDAEGWQSFVSDPEVPPIMQEAGHKGRPQAAELGGQYDA